MPPYYKTGCAVSLLISVTVTTLCSVIFLSATTVMVHLVQISEWPY